MVDEIMCIDVLKSHVRKTRKNGVAVSGNGRLGETVYFIGCKKGEKPEKIIRLHKKDGNILIERFPLDMEDFRSFLGEDLDKKHQDDDVPYETEKYPNASLDIFYNDIIVREFDGMVLESERTGLEKCIMLDPSFGAS